MEVKLLDLTDKNKDRKHDKEEEMDMKKEKQKEVMTKWNNNLNNLYNFLQVKKSHLFGFLKKKSSSQEMKLEKELDRVEAAFKKMDKDGDGYVDWEEFKQVKNRSI